MQTQQNIEHNTDYNIEYSFLHSRIKVNHLITKHDVMEGNKVSNYKRNWW